MEEKEGLKKSEARFRSYFNLPMHGIIIISLEKEWIAVNDRICSMSGYSRDEITRMTWLEMIHPDDLAANLEQFNRVLSGQIGHYSMDRRFIRKDGQVVWTNLSVGCVQRSDGSVDHIIAVVEDITDHKQMEEALRKSENKYRIIAENTADLIGILDMNLRLTYVSPNIMRLRGLTVDEAMAQTLEQVLTPESLRLGRTVFEEEMQLEASAKADPDRTRILELEAYKKDGFTIWVEVSFSFLRDNDRKPVEIITVSRDITERKQAEKELKLFAENLEDANIALRVLMNRRDKDEKEFEEKLQVNINDLVIPYLKKLKMGNLDDRNKNYVSVLEKNLSDVLSPFMRDILSSHKNLTPQEIQIIDLIRQGKNTKEIANMLNASANTIATHRDNIRKKMNLINSKINLRSHILSLK